MTDGYDKVDSEDGYGPSPATQAREKLYVRPALAAVAVEILVVVFFGNEWMLNHVVVPWNTSANILKRSVSDAFSAVGWTLSPHGFVWFWLGSILHALVWFAVTYLLVRRVVEVQDRVGRAVGVIGAVLLAQLAALVVDRLVGYPNVSDFYGSQSLALSKPTFLEWLLSGAIGTGGVLVFAVIGVLVAAAVGSAISLNGTDDPGDERDDPLE